MAYCGVVIYQLFATECMEFSPMLQTFKFVFNNEKSLTLASRNRKMGLHAYLL